MHFKEIHLPVLDRAVAKISKNLVAYLACLIVVTPYVAGWGDTRAAGLAEAHTDIVLKYLKLVTVSYTESRTTPRTSSVSLWTGMPPRRSPTIVLLLKRRPTKRPPRRGRGGGAGVRNRWLRCLIWIGKPLQPDCEAKEDKQTYGTSSGRI